MRHSLPLTLGVFAAPALAGIASSRGDSSSWQPAKQTPSLSGGASDANIGVLNLADDAPQQPAPTSGPRLASDDIFKRIAGYTMNSNTCGFVTSEWSQALTCVSATYGCTNVGNYRGCCGDPLCTAIKTKCIDYATSLMGGCATLTDYHTVCCQSILQPYCFTYVFSTSGSVYSALACDTTSGVGSMLDYPPIFTASTSTSASASNAVTVTDDSPTASSSATGNVISTVIGGVTVTITRANSPTATSESSSSKSKTPTGAIVGGVVGGVGALVIVGALVFFFLRRNKNKTAAPTVVAPMAPAAPGPGSAAPGGVSPLSPNGTSISAFPPSTYSGYPPQGQPSSPSTMTYGSSAGQPGGPQQGYVYPAGYAPPGQAPYGAQVAGVPQHTPSPPVTESAGLVGAPMGVAPTQHTTPSPPPVEMGTQYPMGSENNRAELR